MGRLSLFSKAGYPQKGRTYGDERRRGRFCVRGRIWSFFPQSIFLAVAGRGWEKRNLEDGNGIGQREQETGSCSGRGDWRETLRKNHEYKDW